MRQTTIFHRFITIMVVLLCIGMTGAWVSAVVSPHWISWTNKNRTILIGVACDAIVCAHATSPSTVDTKSGLRIYAESNCLQWFRLPEIIVEPARIIISFPMLPGVLAGWLMCALLFRRVMPRNRSSTVNCQDCGYDMRGSTCGRCPECGAVVPGWVK